MLQQSIELAEAKVDGLSRGDARAKMARIAQCEEAMRETASMRKSYLMEFQLLKPPEKQPYRLALEAYDRRIANIEQKVKWEKAALDKETLTGNKGQPATADQMLKATTELQNKAQESLLRTKKTIGETREIGLEIIDTLQGQTEQIIRIDQGVAGVSDETARANQILASIARRMATDKVIICFAVLLTGVIVAVIVLTSTGAVSISGSGNSAPPAVPGASSDGGPPGRMLRGVLKS